MHHNLIDHSQVIKSGFTINKSEEVLEKFESFGLNLVLSGHIYIQDISSYENTPRADVEGWAKEANINSEELINSPGFKLWEAAGSGFSQRYINSIIGAKVTDDNKLHITKASK